LATEIRDGLVACCVAFRASHQKDEPATLFSDRFVEDLVDELAPLWVDLDSSWDDPGIDDVQAFSKRLAERLAIPGAHALSDVQRLLHAALLVAGIAERLEGEQAAGVLTLIPGGGEHPAGPGPLLRLVPPL
jgi:hypothetical protein